MACHRPLSVFQLGWFQAQRLLHRGHAWARVWLQPLPGPDPPDGMQWVDPPPVAPFGHKDADWGFTYPCQAP